MILIDRDLDTRMKNKTTDTCLKMDDAYNILNELAAEKGIQDDPRYVKAIWLLISGQSELENQSFKRSEKISKLIAERNYLISESFFVKRAYKKLVRSLRKGGC